MRRFLFTAGLCGSLCACAAFGQAVGFAYQAQGGPSSYEFHSMTFDMVIDGKVVTGSPYTAKAVTTSNQVLADGNRITRTTEVNLARDSQGRTRREQTIEKLGPWAADSKASKGSVVTINDPVAQVHITLMPDGQNATRVSTVRSGTRLRVEKGVAEVKAKAMSIEGPVVSVDSPATAFVVTGDGNMVYGAAAGVHQAKRSASAEQSEDLGTQVIEGVLAQGKRTKTVIPAGQIGNERPIEIVNEVWYSNELQTVVLSKRSDPRLGDTEFRLTNVQRTEPPTSMFEVPAGYTVKEEK